MKRPKTILKELREDLHYWQMRARMNATSLRRTREKVKEIGARMREAQKLLKRRRPEAQVSNPKVTKG